MKRLNIFAALALAGLGLASPAFAEGEHHFEYERQQWSFAGFFGHYDKAQLQRGFQIYQQVCSNCHSLQRVRFRNLVEKGGPEFPEEAIKKLAADWANRPLEASDAGETVASKDGKTKDGKTVKKGELLTRAPLLSDAILGPYRNDAEARAAQNGALPPDLSVIAKARDLHNGGFWLNHLGKMAVDVANGYQEGGPDYIYNLLLNYTEPPADVKMADGMNYNAAFPGNQIAMVPPLSKDNFVKYEDGKGSLEENAHDVAAFLEWAADPALDARKAMGWQVLLYLFITSGLLYIGKKRIWADVAH